jgi:hypothetical protein
MPLSRPDSGSIRGMAEFDLESKFETRMDPRTGRWDVVRCEPTGAEFVLGSYPMHHNAICEVLRLSRSVSMVAEEPRIIVKGQGTDDWSTDIATMLAIERN